MRADVKWRFVSISKLPFDGGFCRVVFISGEKLIAADRLRIDGYVHYDRPDVS
jgi:hypothetical protein